jgi:hypothetical protein
LLFFCLRTLIKYIFRICMQVYTYVKCTLLFRQRLLLYYNTFLRLSTEIHMKHLPFPQEKITIENNSTLMFTILFILLSYMII